MTLTNRKTGTANRGSGPLIQHCADNVLQLELHDASPWLFSVKSALSWPSILLGSLHVVAKSSMSVPFPHIRLQGVYFFISEAGGKFLSPDHSKKFTFQSCLPFQDRWCQGKADERSYCGAFMILS